MLGLFTSGTTISCASIKRYEPRRAEAKVTTKPWSLEDMVALVDEWKAAQNAEKSN